MPNDGKVRKRGKRAGKKVHERQQRAAEASAAAEQISDSEIPPSPVRNESADSRSRSRSPERSSPSPCTARQALEHRTAPLVLKERIRSRTPVTRASKAEEDLRESQKDLWSEDEKIQPRKSYLSAAKAAPSTAAAANSGAKTAFGRSGKAEAKTNEVKREPSSSSTSAPKLGAEARFKIAVQSLALRLSW